jgi:hypothetical protein
MVCRLEQGLELAALPEFALDMARIEQAAPLRRGGLIVPR